MTIYRVYHKRTKKYISSNRKSIFMNIGHIKLMFNIPIYSERFKKDYEIHIFHCEQVGIYE